MGVVLPGSSKLRLQIIIGLVFSYRRVLISTRCSPNCFGSGLPYNEAPIPRIDRCE
jgi:hypothetical protein